MNDVHFRLWVARSIHAVSGIWPLEFIETEREWALTYGATRMVGMSRDFFDANNPELAPDIAIVTTNLDVLH